MRSFAEECEILVPLQSFDPKAFVGGSDAPQSMCSFILALALIYNDCKDVMYADLVLQESRPSGAFERSPRWGAFTGINLHVIRLHMSLLHELFELIRTNQEVVRDPAFTALVQQLRSRGRTSWEQVVDAAINPHVAGGLSKALLLARNKVLFHYDPKAIFGGFQKHFLSSTPRDDRAFVSRGISMQASRFYFADAAAQDYLLSIANTADLDGLLREVAIVLQDVNQALMEIVERFIQKRCVAFRDYREPEQPGR